MTEDGLPAAVQSLLAVLDDRPRDVALRIHVAEQLIAHGEPAAAARQFATVLEQEPGNADALRVLAAASTALCRRNATQDPAHALCWLDHAEL